MHWKNRIWAVILVVCMVTACIIGSKVDETGDPEGLAGLSVFPRKETIYFWYADDTLTDFLNSAAVSFGNEHKVRVIPVLVDESEYLEAVNEASLHSSRIPDLFLLSHESLEKAYLAGLASEITGETVVNPEHFPQAALSAVTYHDKQVAYPFSYETSVLVYNDTYLQEWTAQQVSQDRESTGEEVIPEDMEEVVAEDGTANGEQVFEELPLAERQAMTDEELTAYYRKRAIPATVEEILYVADSFDVPEGVEGIMKWDVSDIFYNYWFVGEYMIVGGDPGDQRALININNEEAVQCLEVYKTLNQFFSIESDTVTVESVTQDFIDGKLVYTVATSEIIAKLEQAAAEGSLAFSYGYAQMPEVSSQLESRSLSVTTAVAVNGYSGHQELANEFAAYLVQDCAEMLYDRTGKLPACADALSGNEAVQIFQAEYADSVPLPKMMSTANYWIQLEVLFARVWNGGDVRELVQELQERIQGQ